MYTVTDNRERNSMISFEDVEIGEFFYGQIFDGSFNENKEQFCLKVDGTNYFCFQRIIIVYFIIIVTLFQ